MPDFPGLLGQFFQLVLRTYKQPLFYLSDSNTSSLKKSKNVQRIISLKNFHPLPHPCTSSFLKFRAKSSPYNLRHFETSPATGRAFGPDPEDKVRFDIIPITSVTEDTPLGGGGGGFDPFVPDGSIKVCRTWIYVYEFQLQINGLYRQFELQIQRNTLLKDVRVWQFL